MTAETAPKSAAYPTPKDKAALAIAYVQGHLDILEEGAEDVSAGGIRRCAVRCKKKLDEALKHLRNDFGDGK